MEQFRACVEALKLPYRQSTGNWNPQIGGQKGAPFVVVSRAD
jgi:hypothetical protein